MPRPIRSVVLRAAVAAVLAAGLPTTAAAQERVPVLLDMTVSGDDAVGRMLTFELKEGLRGARSFRPVDDPKAWPYLRVAIVTLKAGEVTSALGVTYVYDDPRMPLDGAFIYSAVHTCGRDRTSACARSLLAGIDEAANQLRRADATLYRTLVGGGAAGVSGGVPGGVAPARMPPGMQPIGSGPAFDAR